MFAIVHGNLRDGFVFIGPFTSEPAAIDYGLRKLKIDFETVQLQDCGDAMDWTAEGETRTT
jgi:hypothetical protein